MKRFLAWCKRLRTALPRPTFGQVAAALSLLALAILCYLAGAAAMYFGLPTSDFLTKAFNGAEHRFAGDDSGPGAPGSVPENTAVTADRLEKCYAGLTLYTTTLAAEATLIDLRGRVVHRWRMPGRRPWPRAVHVKEPLPHEPLHWEKCHLYPNGDLLALCCAGPGSPYGYGLGKFDKDSRLLWGYSANVHHDVTVGEDGRIYTLTCKLGAPRPPELPTLPDRFVADSLVVLSPEGRELASIPLVEAFRNSPYLLALLSGTETVNKGATPGASGPQPAGFIPPGSPTDDNWSAANSPDILHTNSVQVLSRALATKFPLFKAGQVLLSLRGPSLLAVLDTDKRAVVWASRGVWVAQHDARFLDSGRLLVFDNLGSPKGSRVLEYDPVRQATPWWYAGVRSAPIDTIFRGASQRLPNGNTLIVNSAGCRLSEVTADKEVVWQWVFRTPPGPPNQAAVNAPNITGARRYSLNELPFLKGAPHVEAK
jgi:hypothetical protein